MTLSEIQRVCRRGAQKVVKFVDIYPEEIAVPDTSLMRRRIAPLNDHR
jgi:hypothetical protein